MIKRFQEFVDRYEGQLFPPYPFSPRLELYSHGKYLRKWLGWPQWLPLPAYSDHGVSLDCYHAKHEEKSEYLSHFYWSLHKFKYSSIRSSLFKRYFFVPHPYYQLLFEFKNSSLTCQNDSGLLVFWPHTTSKYYYNAEYVSAYLKYIRDFAPSYENIDICISSNDYSQPWLNEIKSSGFPVVTAGSSRSPLFAARLFDLISKYQYATSPLGGSQVFYCTMLGLKYFIGGPKPNYFNHGDENIPIGNGLNRSMAFNSNIQMQEVLFSQENIDCWSDKVSFTEELTGISSQTFSNKIFINLLLAFDFLRLSLLSLHGIKMFLWYSAHLLRITYTTLIRSI